MKDVKKKKIAMVQGLLGHFHLCSLVRHVGRFGNTVCPKCDVCSSYLSYPYQSNICTLEYPVDKLKQDTHTWIPNGQ